MQSVAEYSTIESIFIRERNALLVRGQFTPIYTDYYLHLMEENIRHNPELDEILKNALAVFTLHLVARPWAETIAWTVNLRAPRINLFVTGGSTQEAITGRIFTDDVREPDRNLFYSQTTSPSLPEPRTSSLEVDTKSPLDWIRNLYDQSEQRPARAFALGDEHFALVAAQPDCDMEWFDQLTAEQVQTIDSTEQTSPLETRKFRFHCGCTLERILPVLGSWQNRLDELFGNQDEISVQCPRCAAKYAVTREMIESDPSE